jgi:23S rRNA pseudouridine1911/1915/1917 synthase
MERTFTLVADLTSEERADKYLLELFADSEDLSGVSRSQIQKLIDAGAITVSGKTIRTKDKIPLGAEIQVKIPAPVALEALPENIPLQVLFEDAHLIVINKQPGLTVHPSETQKSGTLVNALLYHVKDLSGIGGTLRPGIVHRIDKETSGALVVTKSDQAHAGLSKLFATHTIERKYWALVYGAPNWDASYKFTSTIDRSPNDRKKMAVNVEGGRLAVSHFKRLEAYAMPSKTPFAAMIEAKLETGRTHQVRAHLNHLHHSLLGDKVYGPPGENQPKWKALPKAVQDAVTALSGQALHARVLGFKHPVTGEDLHFENSRNYGLILE